MTDRHRISGKDATYVALEASKRGPVCLEPSGEAAPAQVIDLSMRSSGPETTPVSERPRRVSGSPRLEMTNA